MDNSQEKFEAWARKEFGMVDADFKKHYGKNYCWHTAYNMWEAWQAAIAAQQPAKDCPNCFEGTTEFGHICRVCNGAAQQPAPDARKKHADLCAYLREYASNTDYSYQDYADTMRAAADALEAAPDAQSPATATDEQAAIDAYLNQPCAKGSPVSLRSMFFKPSYIEKFSQGWMARAAWKAAPAGDALDAARLDFLENCSADLRCESVPTGGDDYDIMWGVFEHYMSAPNLREVGAGLTAREAIDAAMREKGGA